MFSTNIYITVFCIITFSTLMFALILKKKELRVRDKSLEITLLLFISSRLFPFMGQIGEIVGFSLLIGCGLYILTTVQLLSQTFNVYKIRNSFLMLSITAIGYLYSIFGIIFLFTVSQLCNLVFSTFLVEINFLNTLATTVLIVLNSVKLFILLIGSVSCVLYSFILISKHR